MPPGALEKRLDGAKKGSPETHGLGGQDGRAYQRQLVPEACSRPLSSRARGQAAGAALRLRGGSLWRH